MRCAASATASTRDMGGRVALPTLAPDVLAHGARVAAYLRDCVMQAGGKLDFAEFMQQSLYAPGLGYYAAGMAKFGAQGDFVTAPEVSPLFAQSLAQQVAEILQRLGAGAEVLEFGAGSGALALELLLELERLECLPARYLILEVSASLRASQRARLEAQAGHLLSRVVWLDGWPQDFVGVMLGNEVLDAMPLRILQVREQAVDRLAVTIEGDSFAWTNLPLDDGDKQHLHALETARGRAFASGYRVEFHPAFAGWMQGVAQALQRGVLLLLDYGTTASDLYADERWMGSLRCHLRHHAHDDPLIYPGLQDITAWVDFSEVAKQARAQGLEVWGYTTQAHFLLGCGLPQVFERAFAVAEREVDRLQLAQGFKTLMMPGEMGERFKVIALGRDVVGRNVDDGLLGFAWRDFSERL